MSEELTPLEGLPEDSNTPPVYTPAQWLADWLAFQGARLDTAEEQRDWILVHFAGKYPASEEEDRSRRLMKAMIWMCQNREVVSRVASWAPGTPTPPLLVQALYMMFGCPWMDSAPPPSSEDFPEIYEMLRQENIRNGIRL